MALRKFLSGSFGYLFGSARKRHEKALFQMAGKSIA
jgi:hypothetical protein